MSMVTIYAFLAATAYTATAILTFEYLEGVWYENEEDIGGPPIFAVLMFFSVMWPIFWPTVTARGAYLFWKEKRSERKAKKA